MNNDERKISMKSVFIIDDDQSVIDGLLKHVPWSSLNLQIQHTACNGEEALQKVRMDPPDILITDIYMPKMNGLELIKKLHEEFPQVSIIVHSGYDHFDNARVAMRYGVKHFCLKPSTLTEIEGVIKEIIQEIEIKEKEKKLIDRFNAEMNDYLLYSKDALMRELLMRRSTTSSIPSEKLELLQLSKDCNVVVSSLALIRPPYLTKSQEREWQLMKFSTGNIIILLIILILLLSLFFWRNKAIRIYLVLLVS
jgi:YesN/AraC family two-component response regulator